MERRGRVTVRKFQARDIPAKVKWVNDPENNRFLHYDLPLEEEKTLAWFRKNQDRTDRFDGVIEFDGVPVGLIGLLSIAEDRSGAEYYVQMGETAFKGQGIAKRATELILAYAFRELHLATVRLYTETGNIPAQRLFAACGFR